jgi:hypothetical protein
VVPDLYRGKPVDVDVRDDLLGEIDRHEGYILMAVQVLLPGGDNRLGSRLDQVVHDGKVVRRKVPEHIDIVLEEAQIHARGIVVIELAQCFFIEQLPDLLDRAGKQEGVVHHDPEILFQGQVRSAPPLRGIAGERLLNEDVLAVFERGFCQLVVRPDRERQSPPHRSRSTRSTSIGFAVISIPG